MSRKLRVAAPLALALSLSACMGGLLGGGGKAPPWLLTLTPQAPAPESVARTAGPGEAVTIAIPVIPKEIRTTRVPVHSGPIAIAYVEDLTWVDTPDRLFQDLLHLRQEIARVVERTRRERGAHGAQAIAEAGEMLREAVVQIAGDAGALAVDRRLPALAEAQADGERGQARDCQQRHQRERERGP